MALPLTAKTWYVTITGDAAKDGTTWANAIPLQLALSVAVMNDEIWVAKGTYTPTTSTTDRTASFIMKEGVKIYGSFKGDETILTARTPSVRAANPSILSGDIDSATDPLVIKSRTNSVSLIITGYTGNSYHVVLNDNNGLTSAAVLDGFTIMGGYANSAIPTNRGGGMYNISSSPSLNNLIFSGNKAFHGAGMYNFSCSPILTNLVFSDNEADWSGGGIWNISSNSSLHNVSFLGNIAVEGGGMCNLTSSPSLHNIIFWRNAVSRDGGGMSNESSNPSLSNVIFSNNGARNGGGGMSNLSSSPNLSNVTFSSNSASNCGGGMYNFTSSSPSLNNVTFSNNIATNISGGMYNELACYPNIENSVFWENKQGVILTIGVDVKNSASTATFKHTLLQLPSSNYGSGFILGTGNIFAQNPFFVNESNPAGADGIFLTLDDGLMLLPCSPAIDKGVLATATDIIGTAVVGTARDWGAYENTPSVMFPSTIIYVNQAVFRSGNGFSWGAAVKELREALALAASCSQLTEIWVAKGTYRPTASSTDRTASFIMREGVKIYGSFKGNETALSERTPSVRAANPSILSGDIDYSTDPLVITGSGNTLNITGNNGNSYHVVFNDNNNLTNAAILDGFTITGGNANGIPILSSRGAGMFNITSSPMINNVIFYGNSASNAGGGLCNTLSSSPTLSNLIFSSNYASYGGGMYNETSASPTLNNAIFWGNGAFSGGGIFNVNMCLPILNNLTFSDNSSYRDGGSGVHSERGSNPTIHNSIFWGNKRGGSTTLAGVDIANGFNAKTTVSNTAFQLANNTTNYPIIIFSVIATGNNLYAQNPLFVNASNPAGADGIFQTADDGLMLLPCSPAINASGAGATLTDIVGRMAVGTRDLGAYESPLIPLSIATPNVGFILCQGSETTIRAVASGGSGTVQYSLNGGAFQTNPAFTVRAGTYTITAKDGNGCTATTTPTTVNDGFFALQCPQPITVEATQMNADGTVPVTASGDVRIISQCLTPTAATAVTNQVFDVNCGVITPQTNSFSLTSLVDMQKAIVRTFAASAGVVTYSCHQNILVRQPKLEDVVFPANRILTCANLRTEPTDAVVNNATVSGTGSPISGSTTLNTTISKSLTATYTDVRTTTPTGVTIQRTWTVTKCVDGNANNNTTRTFVQTITVPTCGTAPSIAGSIGRENGTAVPATTLLFNSLTGRTDSTTGATYSFANLLNNSNVRVKPTRPNTDWTSGVTMLDVSLLSRHVLDVNPLTSPYSIISADVNADGEVDATDMLLMQRLILRLIPALPNNNSWRFIVKNHVFRNPANPFASDFPELLVVPNLTSALSNGDFVAIKVGDLNQSAGSVTIRGGAKPFVLNTEDIVLEKGKTYQIPIQMPSRGGKNVDNGKNVVEVTNLDDVGATAVIQSLQFTLNVDKNAAKIERIENGNLPNFTDSNTGLFQKEGIITAAWYQKGEQKLNETDNFTMMTVTLTPTKTTRLSEIMTINSAYTEGVAYDAKGTGFPVQLSFGNQKASGEKAVLLPNRPNPFSNETTLSFTLPEASTAKLTVCDLLGKVLMVRDQAFAKGLNEVVFDATPPPSVSSGVFVVRLQTATGLMEQKIVLQR